MQKTSWKSHEKNKVIFSANKNGVKSSHLNLNIDDCRYKENIQKSIISKAWNRETKMDLWIKKGQKITLLDFIR